MKISVIGAGYVGLTTAACLAQIGHDVFCGEKDIEKLAQLQNGKMPIFEPHLDYVIDAARQAGRLHFGSTEDAVEWGVAIFICVGTPPLPNGDADLHAIEVVASIIAKRSTGYRLIVEKSTVPVQTGAQLRRHLAVHSTRNLDYDVASNPEFLREGTSVEDFLHPDRIVVGAESARAADMLREIYQPIIDQRLVCPIHAQCPPRKAPRFLVTDTNSSELIKHASNSFLAMKISFINMVSDLCEAAGADINMVSEGIGLDPRIGPSFLQPGIGFGGFCFPKDLQAFVRIAEKFGCDFALLKEVERINQRRAALLVEKIKKELWVLRGKKLCVLGLAFKPNTDDIRFAPALSIIRRLQAEGALIQAYDPKAMDKAMQEISDIAYCQNVYEAAKDAAAVVLLTEWEEFRTVDWDQLSRLVDRPLIIDGRNYLSSEVVASHGFEYVGLGGISAAPQMRAAVVNG
ncbi:MAG TPA: UDP-glucose/GDP-mannose dehydrogenase family protein [Terracidiphilus sp.]|jgi:UDPglucose 6-dehydrogenase|nr:UDP-glucose/GDP-mannose dehydrogenase family protein [Terracidiphilus sp.]